MRTNKRDGHRSRHVKLDEKVYAAHRLAWLYMTGAWPTAQIDHVDQDSLNNRWKNLREVSCSENQKNRPIPRNNTSGVVGVVWYKRKSKWNAQIAVAGRYINGGLFTFFDDAVAKRKELEKKYSFHPNHGADRLPA